MSARPSDPPSAPPAEIFKAYDIRGIYGEQIDGDVAERIGRAFARVLSGLAGKLVSELRVGLGHDMRVSAPELSARYRDGLTAEGALGRHGDPGHPADARRRDRGHRKRGQPRRRCGASGGVSRAWCARRTVGLAATSGTRGRRRSAGSRGAPVSPRGRWHRNVAPDVTHVSVAGLRSV